MIAAVLPRDIFVAAPLSGIEAIIRVFFPKTEIPFVMHFVRFSIVVVLKKEVNLLHQLVPTFRRVSFHFVSVKVTVMNQFDQLDRSVLPRKTPQPPRNVIVELSRMNFSVAQ